jgi:hypothetical protein
VTKTVCGIGAFLFAVCVRTKYQKPKFLGALRAPEPHHNSFCTPLPGPQRRLVDAKIEVYSLVMQESQYSTFLPRSQVNFALLC